MWGGAQLGEAVPGFPFSSWQGKGSGERFDIVSSTVTETLELLGTAWPAAHREWGGEFWEMFAPRLNSH